MPITQHFILEGRYCGSAPRQMTSRHGPAQVPPSYAFFCPVCAEVWARCPVEVVAGSPEKFMVWTKACRRHYHHSLEVPGSIHLDWDKEFTESFPLETVRWEFERHLDFAEIRLKLEKA